MTILKVLMVIGCALLPALGRGQPVPLGGDFQVNTYTTAVQRHPAAAMDAAGNFVIAWKGQGSGYDIHAQRYDASGAAVGGEFQVNSVNTTAEFYPAAAATPGGEFLIVWQRHTDGLGIFGRRFDEAGVPLSAEFQVSATASPGHQYAAVASDGIGRLLVVWSNYDQDGDDYGVYAQRYDGSGVPLGSEFAVNSYTTGAQHYAAAAADASGNMVIVWQSEQNGGGIFARRYDSGGTPQGTEFQVNTYTTGRQIDAAVAMSPSGSFMVAWTSDDLDGSAYAIRARRYDSGGAPQGGEFQVNSYTTGNQFNVAAAPGLGGGFVLVWEGNGFAGAGGVYGQAYDGTGAPDGPEFRAFESSVGKYPTIAGDAAGRFVVAWDELFTDGDAFGVFARRFAIPGTATIGARKLVITNPADTSRRKIVFITKNVGIDTTAPAGVDAAVDGAFLQVYNTSGTGESECLPLPAASWAALGDSASPTFRYQDMVAANGPCHAARIRDGALLKVVCTAKNAPITYSLDEPAQLSVGVRFRSGDTEYCTEFAGASVVKDDGQRFVAKNAPAPVVCPPVLVACP